MFEAWVLVCIAGQLNQCISARDTRGPYETIEQCQERTVEMSASILNTIGGIKINEHTEVMDKQDNSIPGLYAAGVDTGGWESPTYCWQIAGHAFGFAVYSGRIAGENAARFVLGK